MSLIDIDSLMNGTDLFDKHTCNDVRLDKAIKIIMAAAKMTAYAGNILRSYSNDNPDPIARKYARLASEIVLEASTLTAAAHSICSECDKPRTS